MIFWILINKSFRQICFLKSSNIFTVSWLFSNFRIFFEKEKKTQSCDKMNLMIKKWISHCSTDCLNYTKGMLYNRFAHECNWLNILLICILRFFWIFTTNCFHFFCKKKSFGQFYFSNVNIPFFQLFHLLFYYICLIFLLEYYSKFRNLDDFTERKRKVVARLFFEFFLNMKSVNDEKNIKKKFWKFGFVCLSVSLSFSVFTNSV